MYFKSFLLFLFLCVFTFGQEEAKAKKDAKTIKVMSYNIHYGIGMDKKKDLARIAKVILKEKPDIVGLQEISNLAMAKELGKLTGMKFVFGPSLGSNKRYGDAILSKYPFKVLPNHSIPSASSSRYQALGIDVDLSTLYGKEKTVRFITTHFDWLRTLGSHFSRMASVDLIEKAFMDKNKLSTILTGDFNAKPDSEPIKKLIQKGWITSKGSYNTHPAPKPTKQIDYVMIRKNTGLKVLKTKVMKEPVASDHLPVVMMIELK